MLELLSRLLVRETTVSLVVSIATFAALLTAMAPLLRSDPMKKRVRAVSAERGRIRAEQKTKSARKATLRDSHHVVASRFVDILRLRQVFEPDASRELLRQAGLRSDRHVMFYLLARGVAPIGLGLLTFLYVSTFFADSLSLQSLIAFGAMGAVAGNYLPSILLRNLIVRRRASIRRAWPDSLDLLLICVEAGMAIEPAIKRVAHEIGAISMPLADEMSLVVAELSFLQDRRKAFENLAKRTGMPEVKAVVTSFIQAERYGTPLGTALRVLAQENRDMRMAEAERRAAALPPRLTVPMMLFFMPVLFVVIMAPAIMMVWDLLP